VAEGSGSAGAGVLAAAGTLAGSPAGTWAAATPVHPHRTRPATTASDAAPDRLRTRHLLTGATIHPEPVHCGSQWAEGCLLRCEVPGVPTGSGVGCRGHRASASPLLRFLACNSCQIAHHTDDLSPAASPAPRMRQIPQRCPDLARHAGRAPRIRRSRTPDSPVAHPGFAGDRSSRRCVAATPSLPDVRPPARAGVPAETGTDEPSASRGWRRLCGLRARERPGAPPGRGWGRAPCSD
jgi:hypothetical protein